MTPMLSAGAKPRFTFINNDAQVGDRLTAEQQRTVRRHCRNRWRQEREDNRKVQPEIRIIRFGEPKSSRTGPAKATQTASIRLKSRQPIRSQLILSEAQQQDLISTLPDAAHGIRRNEFLHPPSAPFTSSREEPRSLPQQCRSVNLSSIDNHFRAFDPFDVLPLPATPTTSETLHYYVHEHMNCYSRLEPSSDLAKARRRDFWMPIAARDEAAYCALMAHLQTDQNTPAHLKSSDFLQICLARAITLTNQRLADAHAMLSTETLFAVGMLNFMAWSTMDFNAMMIHGRGFETLIACRSGRYISANGYYASALVQHASMSKTKGYEHGFVDICKRGLIDTDLSHPFRFYLGRISYVLELDRAATCFLLDHIVLNPCNIAEEAQAMVCDPKQRLQNACHAAIHVCSFLVFQNPWSYQGTEQNLGLEECVDQVHRCVFAKGWESRCDEIWATYPLVLLWLATVSGAATRSASKRQDFKWLLEQSKDVMQLHDFATANDLLSTYFTWPESLTDRTKSFWCDADRPTSSSFGKRHSRPFGTLSVTHVDSSKSSSPTSDDVHSDGAAQADVFRKSDQDAGYDMSLLVNPHSSTWFWQDSPFEKPLRDKHCFLMAMQLMLNHICESGKE